MKIIQIINEVAGTLALFHSGKTIYIKKVVLWALVEDASGGHSITSYSSGSDFSVDDKNFDNFIGYKLDDESVEVDDSLPDISMSDAPSFEDSYTGTLTYPVQADTTLTLVDTTVPETDQIPEADPIQPADPVAETQPEATPEISDTTTTEVQPEVAPVEQNSDIVATETQSDVEPGVVTPDATPDTNVEPAVTDNTQADQTPAN